MPSKVLPGVTPRTAARRPSYPITIACAVALTTTIGTASCMGAAPWSYDDGGADTQVNRNPPLIKLPEDATPPAGPDAGISEAGALPGDARTSGN